MAFKLPIDNETIAASGTYRSDGISLHKDCSSFSLYYEITGDGSVDFFVYTSPDGVNFVKNSRALKRGQTDASGPGADGKDMIHVPIIPCDAFKIEAEETGGADSATVTCKLNLLPGSFGDFPLYDGASSAITTMQYEHHEIHSGSHYFVKGFLDIPGVDDVLDFTWLMPDTSKWTHWIWSIFTEKALAWYVYEDVVATNALANTMTPFNSDRNSDNTSGTVLKYEIQADLATANADTAVGGDAVLLKSGQLGDNKGGGEDSRSHEMILKQGSLYCLRAVASAAGYINFDMEWYEHTNR